MKKMVVAALAAGTIGVTGLSAGSVLAHQNGNGDFASAIAERFNLEETEVQAFLDEQQEARAQEREQEREAHLQSLVDDGTLTAEQKDALTAKLQEQQEARESLRDQELTQDERREQMRTLRDDFQAWAEEQGIDLKQIRPEGDHGRRGGHQNRH